MNMGLLHRVTIDASAWTGVDVDRMQKLVGILGVLIFDRSSGGFEGFVSRFQSASLGHLIHSWIANGPNQSISAIQVEQTFGLPTIKGLARSLDWSKETTCQAISQVLPELVDELTPGGALPSEVPEPLKRWQNAALRAKPRQLRQLDQIGLLGWLFLGTLMAATLMQLKGCSHRSSRIGDLPDSATVTAKH
jgi:uncharacterized protein YidB (DUF937 family)